MATLPGTIQPVGGYTTMGNTSNYMNGQTGSGSSFIPSYQNLPAGITNAGTGNTSAYTGSVQGNQLVANQLNGLLASNSPYIQQARLAGLNSAASRGLLNSSIAAGNSQAAAIQAAMPIAQQDASTYSNLQTTNLNNLNSILATRMNNQASMQAAADAAGASEYGTFMNNQGALARQREQLAYGGEQAGLNRDFQQYMSQLGYQQGLGLQAFQLAGNMALNNQSFRNNLGLQASQNPFMLQDPSALGGYMDYIGGDFSNNIGDLLNYSMGGF